MSSPKNYSALGNLDRFDITASEFTNLRRSGDLNERCSYLKLVTETMRDFHHDTDRMLLELTFLEEWKHPDPEKRRDAYDRLNQFWLDNFRSPRFEDRRFYPAAPIVGSALRAA